MTQLLEEEVSEVSYIETLRPPALEVGLGEMKKVRAPGVLCSGELGPCIVIALYDPESQSGYMMHEADFLQADLASKLELIRRDFGDLSAVQVAAYGSAVIPGTDPLYLHQQYRDRQYVAFLLEAHFNPEQLHIQWVRNPEAQLILDTGRGFFMIDASEHQLVAGA